MHENRIFRTRTFSRWMLKSGLTDQALCSAVIEMISGLIDADLGSNVVKKRIALPGHGKRNSTRSIVATKFANQWFFLYGFNKSELANISSHELKTIQVIARIFLEFDDEQLTHAIATGELVEVHDEKS